MINFPNTLSLLRIVLAPVFAYMFLSGDAGKVELSFFVFAFAAITDWYDGWFARKYGFRTKWGQFLDPLADKILTSAALYSFYVLNKTEPAFFGREELVPIEILIGIIIFRDIVLTLVRSISELRGREFRTSMISKTKTFIQMVYIFIVIGAVAATQAYAGSGFAEDVTSFLYSKWNYYLLFLITLLTVASAIAYVFESRASDNRKQS